MKKTVLNSPSPLPEDTSSTLDELDERRIRLDAQRYRFLSETIADVIWTMDLNQHITYASPSILSLTGYTVEEVQRMELREILAPESFALAREILLEELRLEYQTDHEPSHTRTLDLNLVRRDGSTLWCEAKMSFLRDEVGRPEGVLGVARDITSWREAQDALAASEERLQQAQRLEAVGQLAGGIAHDFNNLLTVIIGNAELMLSELTADDPLRGQTADIRRAADRAAGLTRQLLAFSRKQMMLPKLLDLNHVVEEIDAMIRGLVGENIEIAMDLYPALAQIRADPSQIELVLVNLAVNARDAMPQGGRLVIETANAQLDADRSRGEFDVVEGPYVLLAVTDSGIGIELEDQDKIFEPFFTTKEVGKGTGLGLATVYGIVKQSGGYIFVSSRPQRGTRFEIYLPAVVTAGSSTDEGSLPESDPRQAETILVVEDEPGVRALTRRVLEEHGYAVLEAPGGATALEVLRDRDLQIDLLLSDVIMPGMSGTRLAAAARELRPDLAVLFMSGHNEEMLDRHDGIEGDAPLIVKPFSPEDLLDRVGRTLRRSPSDQELDDEVAS